MDRPDADLSASKDRGVVKETVVKLQALSNTNALLCRDYMYP